MMAHMEGRNMEPIVSSDSQFGLHIVADKTDNNIFFYYELLDYDMSRFVGDYRRFVLTRCLHPQNTPELYFVDGGSVLLQTVVTIHRTIQWSNPRE